ncbi:MAG: hypothetical protein CO093_10030 [Alphaproteobacteria bacterium CG_4_9_14_3_um_filter_47_13]|nr:MAG: hypothetical protein CO093_10030 [Alphaproteobacteria bacterium CG_4_9_14_3_um_filter_47_13]
MKLFSYLVFLVIFAGACPYAQALETPWASADYLQARLLIGGQQKDSSAILISGFELRLAEGWHAYWRMPGEGGLPPRFDWQGSANITDVKILWPVPERFEMAGFNSFGYEKSVLFPLEIGIIDPQKPVTLDLKADIMVCSNICVPQNISLHVDIPSVRNIADVSNLSIIERSRALVPEQAPLPSLKIESAVIGPDAIVVNAFSQSGFQNVDLYVESGDIYITALPEITIDKGDSRKAMIRVDAPADVENLASAVMEDEIVLTLVKGRNAIEKTVSFNE